MGELLPGWLLSRPTVIALAIAGGAISLLATVLRRRQAAPLWVRRMDAAAYGFMGVSMLLFVIIGLMGSRN